MRNVALGLDIGTSNCCVALARPAPGAPHVPSIEIVPSITGTHLTPSFVAFDDEHRAILGDLAKNQQAANPKRTFHDFKRVLGLKYNSPGLWNKHWAFCLCQPTLDAQQAVANVPVYAVLDGAGQLHEYTAFDLYTILIRHLLERAASRLAKDERLAAVTVTVPAHFDSEQRRQTQAAVVKALGDDAREHKDVTVRVLDEPVAAITAYITQNRFVVDDAVTKAWQQERVMVFDLGGGTLDVTLLAYAQQPPTTSLKVCTSEGCSDLGGIDFDTAILDHVTKAYQRQTKRDMRIDKSLLSRMRRQCEEAKMALSVQTSTQLVVGPELTLELRRDEFAQWIAKHLQRASQLMWKTLEQTKADPTHVSVVIIVGGAAQVPAVRGMIEMFFAPHKVSIRDDVHPTESVAYGAAAHAFGHLGAPAPAAAASPSAAAAAAAPPLKLVPQVASALSANIGIRLPGDIMHVLLRKNTPLPCTARLDIYPRKEGQSRAVVRVFQGPGLTVTESSMCLLGTIEIKLSKKKADRMVLALTMDHGGMLNLRLTNAATNEDVTKQLMVSHM